MHKVRGGSSEVERNLAKVNVEGSIPFFRSILILLILLISPIALADVPTASTSPDGNIMLFRDDDGLHWAPKSADDFCKRYPKDCKYNGTLKKLTLTEKTYQIMWDVNHDVNSSIEVESDQTQYDKEEFWEYPTKGKGDCEDFVLEKRKRLIAAGFPPSSLSLVIVKWMWQWHAVLMVRTDHGDFILDEKDDQIYGWNWKSYVFVARQYGGDPKLWVDMEYVDPNPLGRWFIFLVL